ncbi:hypothetical protein C1752_05058 [Acaryochloris thomasi RCC1774]|uniref:Uncharacterized protein n=1 Tax=Acaryochloris thomasi RCC1774 TaxID=1764569 RepID=A0A2W1JNJ1_9CYAN|nr:hypothetical protein C1752_05058 [Acaryochloris thomasi RCC1774]
MLAFLFLCIKIFLFAAFGIPITHAIFRLITEATKKEA